MKPLTTFSLAITAITIGVPVFLLLMSGNRQQFILWWSQHGTMALVVIFLIICVIRESRVK
jgi:hypothetical protein